MMCYSIFFGVGKGECQVANFLTAVFLCCSVMFIGKNGNSCSVSLCNLTVMNCTNVVFLPPFVRLAAGIIEAVARDFFNSEVTMTVLNQSEEDERTGKKEHVVFLVKQTKQARRTTNESHSSAREVGAWPVSVCMSYAFFLIHGADALCEFPQEALFRTMRGRCVSLAVKKSGWDLIRAVVCTENGELIQIFTYNVLFWQSELTDLI